MEFIPINPEDNDLHSLISSVSHFPFSFVRINNRGDYENENIVFKAIEDVDALSRYILIYSVEDTETGLPDYSQSRVLTFDDIELQKGSFLQIFTRKGEDSSSIEFETTSLHVALYWGLPKAIWSVPHSSFELTRRSDSIEGGYLPN